MILSLCVLQSFIINAETDPIAKIANELSKNLSKYSDKKIAILSIPYCDRHKSETPEVISEKLTLYLAENKHLSVLDRHNIIQILNELHLSETGLVDQSSAKNFGQALGADIIVTGTLIDLDDDKTEVNIRGFLTENGRILAASRTTIDTSLKKFSIR